MEVFSARIGVFGILSNLTGNQLQQRPSLGSVALCGINRRQVTKTNPAA
jgi:hypothetical protein